MKSLRNLLLAIPLLWATSANAAVILSMEPGGTEAIPGDTVVLDLVISGLGAGGADSLGDFDLDLFYDPAALSVTSISLTGLLGDVGLGEAIDLSLGDDGFGTIALTLISTLLDFELDAIQPGSFSLATIEFSVDVLADGTSTEVGIASVFGLGDALGDPLSLMGTGSAFIRNGVVNEPAILGLIALPLLILMRRQRR